VLTWVWYTGLVTVCTLIRVESLILILVDVVKTTLVESDVW